MSQKVIVSVHAWIQDFFCHCLFSQKLISWYFGIEHYSALPRRTSSLPRGSIRHSWRGPTWFHCAWVSELLLSWDKADIWAALRGHRFGTASYPAAPSGSRNTPAGGTETCFLSSSLIRTVTWPEWSVSVDNLIVRDANRGGENIVWIRGMFLLKIFALNAL